MSGPQETREHSTMLPLDKVTSKSNDITKQYSSASETSSVYIETDRNLAASIALTSSSSSGHNNNNINNTNGNCFNTNRKPSILRNPIHRLRRRRRPGSGEHGSEEQQGVVVEKQDDCYEEPCTDEEQDEEEEEKIEQMVKSKPSMATSPTSKISIVVSHGNEVIVEQFLPESKAKCPNPTKENISTVLYQDSSHDKNDDCEDQFYSPLKIATTNNDPSLISAESLLKDRPMIATSQHVLPTITRPPMQMQQERPSQQQQQERCRVRRSIIKSTNLSDNIYYKRRNQDLVARTSQHRKPKKRVSFDEATLIQHAAEKRRKSIWDTFRLALPVLLPYLIAILILILSSLVPPATPNHNTIPTIMTGSTLQSNNDNNIHQSRSKRIKNFFIVQFKPLQSHTVSTIIEGNIDDKNKQMPLLKYWDRMRRSNKLPVKKRSIIINIGPGEVYMNYGRMTQ